MLAYSLLLSVFPVALLALFVAGQVLQSPEVESTVLEDLQRLVPSATDETLARALQRVRENSTSFGVVGLVTSLWIGSSVWGALDTAFCRIYHVRCRSWLEQKRFALVMLLVVVVFMLATVAVPAAQGVLARDVAPESAAVRQGVFLVTLAAGVAALFGVLCVIYWTVPNRAVPWRAVWPGAAAATFAIATIEYAFPAYLSSLSTLAQFGTTFVFVLIVLIWFWLLAFLVLAGGVLNAMALERDEREKGHEPVREEGSDASG